MKRFYLLFVVVVLAILLSSCESELNIENQYGSLTLSSIDAKPRTIEPTLSDLTCTKYVVYGNHKDTNTNFRYEFTTKEYPIDKLLVGNWSICVEGYNADNVLITRSSNENVLIKYNFPNQLDYINLTFY